MDSTPEILIQYESCHRREFYSRDYETFRWPDTRFLQEALRRSLTSIRTDHGEMAGEEVMGFVRDIEIETKSPHTMYQEAMHLARLADILSCALRRPGTGPWRVPEPVDVGSYLWRSGALLAPSGDELRRIVMVSSWSDERHYSECRSWLSLGECAAFNLPMRMAVCVIGQKRDGKRHSHLTKGYLHPFSHKVRFRKKHNVAEGFKDSWLLRWREDDKDISTEEWLQAMATDGVMKDVCFSVEIPVPEPEVRKRVLDLAVQSLDKMVATTELPPEQLTGCFWPVRCPFVGPCMHGEEPSGKYGLVKIA